MIRKSISHIPKYAKHYTNWAAKIKQQECGWNTSPSDFSQKTCGIQ